MQRQQICVQLSVEISDIGFGYVRRGDSQLRDGDVDIAAGCVRIRAHFVGFRNQGGGSGAVHAGQAHLQAYGQAEAAVVVGADVDLGGHGGILGQRRFGLAADEFHGRQETGGIARCEQLFRIGAGGASAAQLLRGGQGDVEGAVAGNGAAVAAAVGTGFCGVKHLHGDLLWGGQCRDGADVLIVPCNLIAHNLIETIGVIVAHFITRPHDSLSSSSRSNILSRTLVRLLRNSPRAVASLPVVQSICWGIARACLRSSRPAGLSEMRTWRSSWGSRLRSTKPLLSSRLSRGVRVPESRNSRAPMSLTRMASCSHSTSMTRYWG